MLTLMYHDVLPYAPDLPGTHQQVTLDSFRRQINSIKNRILAPQDVSGEILPGTGRDGILITFDDGGQGLLDAGKVLADIGKTGVAFICPGSLENGLWFYRLANAVSHARASVLKWQGRDLTTQGASAKRELYRVLSSCLFDLRSSLRDDILDEVIASLSPADQGTSSILKSIDASGLQAAAQTGGLVFANHSWSHPNLTLLSPRALADEVDDAYNWLRESKLPFIDWFAFPAGEYDERVTNVVLERHSAVFGAKAYERSRRIVPRIGVYKKDGVMFRFKLKTIADGQFPALLSWISQIVSR